MVREKLKTTELVSFAKSLIAEYTPKLPDGYSLSVRNDEDLGVIMELWDEEHEMVADAGGFSYKDQIEEEFKAFVEFAVEDLGDRDLENASPSHQNRKI